MPTLSCFPVAAQALLLYCLRCPRMVFAGEHIMELDWAKIFVADLDWSYAAEIVVRTVTMFLLVLILLRLTGKKGVRQLSFFEVAIIVSFGSATGDPMFQEDLAIVPCVIVLVSVILVYRGITWLTMRSEKVESVFEGDPCYVIEDGMFVLSHEQSHTFAKDEFLSEMRQQSIEHLRQVRVAILETNGVISFIFYEDEEVRYGMPVLPKAYSRRCDTIDKPGRYACTYCGQVEELQASRPCSRCEHQDWVEAINTRRVT